MALGTLEVLGLGLFGALLNIGPVAAQSQNGASPTSTSPQVLTATIAGEVVTYSPQFTVPASADNGASLLPNIQDPDVIDAQSVCPGYTASDVVNGPNGFSATLSLAGAPCKYGVFVSSYSMPFADRPKACMAMMSICSI
jgi:alpha-glucosidase